MQGPSFFTKFVFFILLGLISTFFAEVLVPSSIFPFFKPLGLVFTTPLYLLHLLFLGGLIYIYGKPTFPVLYSAGFIFGLYEAYATKVLWFPTWETGNWDLLFGVHWSVVLVVAGFWHAFLAFILPLLIADTFLTKGGLIFSNLPPLIKKIFSPFGLFFLVFLFGVLSTSAMNSGVQLFSPLSSGVVVLATLFVWKKNIGLYEMKDLMPGKRALPLLLFLLFLVYIFAFFFIRQEFFPHNLAPHVAILSLYLFFGLLFFWNLKKSSKTVFYQKENHNFSWPKTIYIFFTFILIGTLSFFLFSGRVSFLVFSWVPFGFFALMSILYTLKKTFKF